ncbi:LRRC15 [Branchiostoma lanceolatum]|uniref:LRRC15 protein n=1 Tax=Branchiostoma lanceolatum TaxID=7740 RepID=A0A8J9ZT30_BRALA|nr:LRRC15 [Branchiostoma lanceolatum]
MAAVALLLLLVLVLPTVPACPDECRCLAKQTTVLCHNSSFTTVPKGIPANTTILEIRHTKLSSLREGDFASLPNLVNLTADTNVIGTIEPGSFSGLHNLKVLNIANNKVFKLPPGLFNGTQNLTSFDAANNEIRAVPVGLFTRHPSLTTVQLSNNNISVMEEEAFAYMTNLMELELDNNQMQTISSYFYNDKSLRRLSLSSNDIMYIGSGALSTCTNLQELVLDNNKVDDLGGIADHLVNLQKLSMSNNHVSRLKAAMIEGTPALQFLYLSNNSIEYVDELAFIHMTNLKYLWLDLNRIQNFSFAFLTNLDIFNISYNSLRSLPTNMTDAWQLQELILSGNPIQALQPNGFAALDHVHEIELANISCVKSGCLGPRSLCGNLVNVVLDSNNFTEFPRGVFDCASLTILSLGYNNLDHRSFHADDFHPLSYLMSLQFPGNKITNTSSLALAMRAIEHLAFFDIRQNPIVYLPEGAFSIPSVSRVDMGGMKLSVLDPGAFHGIISSVTELDLSFNRLQYLPGQIFHGLEDFALVWTDGNPWKCDCQMYDFAKWLQQTAPEIDVFCHSPTNLSGKNLRDISLEELQCDCIHNEAPSIDSTGGDNHTEVGSKARLTCNVTSCPDAAIIWSTPEGVILSVDSEMPRFTVNANGTLMIEDITESDAGEYHCTAVNYLGKDMATVSLKVN